MEYGSGPLDLENAFFAREHTRNLEAMRKKADREQQRELLRNIVKIQDDAFLDRLITMGIGPERAMVLRLIPLIFVAWADGNVDDAERKAILDAATEQGLASEQIARDALGDWLERKPDQELLEMWKSFMSKIWNRFTPDEQLQMRENLLASTRRVAEAAGGFLGLASISAAERKVLDDLEQVVR